MVYILTAVHNFINIHNPDDLEDYGDIEDKVIKKEDAPFIEESDIVINQR